MNRLLQRASRYVIHLVLISPIAIITQISFAECPNLANELHALSNASPSSLLTLQRTINRQRSAAHTLEIKGGRGYLTIGYLNRREDTRFLAAMAQAIREDRIAEIDVGLIVGGKALDLMTKLVDLTPGKTELTGSIRVRLTEQDVRKNPLIKGATADRADVYSDIEVQRYHAAVARLKLKEACLKFRGTTDLLKCDELKFRIDTSRPDDIQWEAD